METFSPAVLFSYFISLIAAVAYPSDPEAQASAEEK
jgi:hypothetical protein